MPQDNIVDFQLANGGVVSGEIFVDYTTNSISGPGLAVQVGGQNVALTGLTLTQNNDGTYTIAGATAVALGVPVTSVALGYGPTMDPTTLTAAVTTAGVTTTVPVSVTSDAIVCYAAGTRIATERGQVAVEDLRPGDLVVTSGGSMRPIRWLGHRDTDCSHHPRRLEVMPVRIAAHAFGAERPARDLRVSPGHAICVDLVGEILIPAGALINGSTIVQEDVERVTYWHVELDSHDIILAENLACESYIDCGNRAFFAEADVVDLGASPDARPATLADYCRPFHADGTVVDAARERLGLRAKALGWRLAEADGVDDLWLEVDGERVVPSREGLVARAILPATAREVYLCSTTAVPAYVYGGTDGRTLGLSIASFTIDDGLHCRREIGCDDARLQDGFHGNEGNHRWTNGRARLPTALWEDCKDVFVLRLVLDEGLLPNWVAPSVDGPVEPALARYA